MTAEHPGATQDYSKRSAGDRGTSAGAGRALPSVLVLRTALCVLGLAGALLLVLSSFTTVTQIRVLTTSDLISEKTSFSGYDLHGPAMIVVAAFAVPMLLGALRGARPAMIAVAATGLLGLGLVIGLDVPDLDNTGQVAKFYEDVSAGASTGFYYETLGAILLLVAGGLLVVLSADGVGERLQRVGGGLGVGAARLGDGLGAGAARAARGARSAGGAAARRGQAGAERARAAQAERRTAKERSAPDAPGE